MAQRGLRPLPAPSPLEHDDRFCAPAAQVKKTLPVGEGFEVETDHPGVGIVQKIFQDVALIDIDFVSQRADLAHPHRGVAHDVDQEDGREHAALNDQGNGPRDEFLALLRPRIHEGKDVAVDAIDKPHAVRPPEADAGAGGDLGETVLQALPFRAGFGETA